MKKKICIFCSLPSFNTGMPISTYKLASGLVRTGRYDVCAVLPGDGELAERLRLAGVDVRVIPFRRLRGNPFLMLIFLMKWVIAGFRLFRFIRGNGVDVVHFADVIDAPFYPWAKFAGARVVAHIRVCVGGAVVKFLFRRWTGLFCSRVITISKFVRRYYKFGKRAVVVYNPGPDRKIFDPKAYPRKTAAAKGAVPAAPSVIAVASFRRDKGHHNFLEIASRINKRLGDKVRFVIVGGEVKGHEDYYREMTGLARKLGLDGRLTVTGNVPHENVPLAMSCASVLLHVPDWEEALGGVILEAMAMNVAVVAYNCGGVGECFTDGSSGFLVKRGDFDDAAEKVVQLLISNKLAHRVTAEAQEELGDKFTLENYAGGVERVYEGL
ncbi:MAG: glycosyltransferase family 4 protein [Chitinispirillia bacterium]|nr:glycosyltransferase family 4 protein [Chitinispirillia bacterium]MCL2219088.1 glycosyltransferase family 4 protein [Chitinispirillia bacterium]